MASGWMKSFQCKSKALDDVVPHPNPDHRRRRHHHHRRSLSNSSSCRNSYQNLKDIVETNKNPKPKPKKPKPPPSSPPPFKRPVSRKTEPAGPTGRSDSIFPSLAELPKDHPSRNVVEIIFHSSWGEKGFFSPQIEMVFKVHSLNRTLARFEEYRDSVRNRAGSEAEASGGGGEDHARRVADGNEVMRFYCLGGAAAGGGAYEACGGAWAFGGGKRAAAAAAVCTYSGSGAAHESGGGGRGRRAMLVCRVVAGRVCKGVGSEERVGYDSVAGRDGELLVFDTRAVLPCFLIIYKL